MSNGRDAGDRYKGSGTINGAGDDVLANIDERLEQLHPDEWKEYRQCWLALPQDERSGQMYDSADWRVLVNQLAERMRLAEILGEPLDGYGRQIRRLLLVDIV